MLIRLGLMEQRHKAVLEVLPGQTVTQAARRYGVCRQTVHRWLGSYAREGLVGLVGASSRPATCPQQQAPASMRESCPDPDPKSSTRSCPRKPTLSSQACQKGRSRVRPRMRVQTTFGDRLGVGGCVEVVSGVFHADIRKKDVTGPKKRPMTRILQLP